MSRIEALPLNEVPERVLQTARRAVHQLGNGLFGVDLRQQGATACCWKSSTIPGYVAILRTERQRTSTSASPGPSASGWKTGAERTG